MTNARAVFAFAVIRVTGFQVYRGTYRSHLEEEVSCVGL
jgi:hypothetical protein